MPKVSKEYKEKRRKEILMIAEKTFIDKGFEATTMTDIVVASGLSRGGVYQYFSSTNEMFKAITEEYDSKTETKINQLIHKYDSAWQAMETYLHSAKENLLNYKLGFAIVQYEYFVTHCRKIDESDYLLKRSQTSIRNLSMLIDAGVEKGEFTPIQSTETIAYFIINTLDGLLMHRVFSINFKNPNVINIEEQIRALLLYLQTTLQVSKKSASARLATYGLEHSD